MDYSKEYRNRFLLNQRLVKKRLLRLHGKAVIKFADLVNDPMIKYTTGFNFNLNIKSKIKTIVADFNQNVLSLTNTAVRYSWKLSNDKNNLIVEQYLKTVQGLKRIDPGEFYRPNTEALNTFLNRAHGKITLSDRVWKNSTQFRNEMEIQLGVGIANGDSSIDVAKRMMQYLQNPTAFSTTVKTKTGQIKRYTNVEHPGRGVYRSAFKNAWRHTRSATNQSFLEADHIAWNSLDMVIGIKVSLSDSHPHYNYVEICEILQGEYPKDYKFIGFHSMCLCTAIPILMNRDDFRAYLRGETDILKANQIKDMPDNFISYVKKEFDKLSDKSVDKQPYWFVDNRKIINGIVGK